MKKRILTLVLLSLSSLLAGCGNDLKYKIVPFAGTVTYQGQPLGEPVLIVFTPAEGRPSSAIADANGKFKAEYTERYTGVQVGKQTVTISPHGNSSGFQAPGMINHSASSEKAQEAFAKYAFGGQGYSIEVDKKSNNYQLDLP
ncbi:MAG: carboxypeptidase-like regulatory domain-containing protein [Planctomycetaceae bacterium]|nr:carboxypeptidase-like regulatory domain-containing protein [Planctomycetaceae bacterium]